MAAFRSAEIENKTRSWRKMYINNTIKIFGVLTFKKKKREGGTLEVLVPCCVAWCVAGRK